MAIAFDITQEDNDLVIDATAKDFLIKESDEQHIEDIIIANVGAYKEFSLVGVGIEQYINASLNPQELERILKIQLKADGYKIGNPKVTFQTSGKLLIQPNAIRQ